MAQQIINIGSANNSGDGESLRSGGDKINDNFTELYQKKYGFLDYNDATTSTTPISVTGNGNYVYLTNDGAGAFTNKTYAPTNVTDTWDASNDRFDFGQLTLGTEMRYRIDLEYTTTTANQVVDLAIELGIGGNVYTLHIDSAYYKTSGVKPVVKYNSIYMGDANTINNYAKFKVKSDSNLTVKVNGWVCFLNMY